MKEDSYEKPISEKIVKLAKDYLGLDLNNKEDLGKYQKAIEKMDNIIQTMNMSNFKDGTRHSSWAAYVDPEDTSHTIYLNETFKGVYKEFIIKKEILVFSMKYLILLIR